MDAYELAEQAEGLAYEIPADWSSGEPKNVATDIADMLRQQADRIAELEKDFKPVAWTNQKWLDGIAKEPQLFQPLFVHGKQTEHNTIPLYTTPQIKELSDEEILDVANNLKESNETYNINFARAILKKASEK